MTEVLQNLAIIVLGIAIIVTNWSIKNMRDK